MGQTSRIGSMDIACKQVKEKIDSGIIDGKNLILASDAFFPFADSIEKAAEY
jgi:AICAR transformylase/IMP cyclohydrolase PurH